MSMLGFELAINSKLNDKLFITRIYASENIHYRYMYLKVKIKCNYFKTNWEFYK